MSDSNNCGCGSSNSSACATKTTTTIQNGKGDAPRNISQKFRTNYDQINWGSSSRK